MSDNIICSGCGASDYIKPKHLLSFTQEEIKCWKCSSCERKNYLESLKKLYLNQESVMTELNPFKKQIQELTEEISNYHRKIIDDCSKAYLSQLHEEGKEIKPGCFTLIEQEPSVYDGVFCRRYWFEQGIPNYSEEKKLEWQPIECAPKEGTEIIGIENEDTNYLYKIRFSDGRWKTCFDDILCNVTHWIPLPKFPKRKHYCKCKHHPISCFTNDIGGLNLMCEGDKVSYVTQVLVCPFCGEKASK